MNNEKPIEDDGLWTPAVKPHCEQKYSLIGKYASIFATSMKHKWDCRVYIDLFAGAGRAKIETSGRIVNGSPLLALGVDTPFDRYIFCDEDKKNIVALAERVQRYYPDAKAVFVQGDSNKTVKKVLDLIPSFSKSFKVLGFCEVDPFRMDDLKFATLQSLSQRYMDFLVLIPTHMDANRNENHYLKEDNHVIDEFLGTQDWRDLWQKKRQGGVSFAQFIAGMFTEQMMTLKYMKPKEFDPVIVRIQGNNVPLYQLMLYSRHSKGQEFWKEARKYSNPQMELEF